MLCVLIFIHKWRDLQLKSTPNDRFFEKIFVAILFALRVFAKNLLRGNRRRNRRNLAWSSNPGFSSYKTTHYLIDQGDFTHEVVQDEVVQDGDKWVNSGWTSNLTDIFMIQFDLSVV